MLYAGPVTTLMYVLIGFAASNAYVPLIIAAAALWVAAFMPFEPHPRKELLARTGRVIHAFWNGSSA